MAHTPGPFFAWDDGRTIGIVAEPDGDPIAIAEVVDHGDMASEEQLLADQRLFAASDKLLAALKLAEKHVDHVCGETTEADLPDWFEDLKTIRSAIAAAEGR